MFFFSLAITSCVLSLPRRCLCQSKKGLPRYTSKLQGNYLGAPWPQTCQIDSQSNILSFITRKLCFFDVYLGFSLIQWIFFWLLFYIVMDSMPYFSLCWRFFFTGFHFYFPLPHFLVLFYDVKSLYKTCRAYLKGLLLPAFPFFFFIIILIFLSSLHSLISLEHLMVESVYVNDLKVALPATLCINLTCLWSRIYPDFPIHSYFVSVSGTEPHKSMSPVFYSGLFLCVHLSAPRCLNIAGGCGIITCTGISIVV